MCRREKSVEFPEFPEIEYELDWRNTVIMKVQQAIISEVKRISFNIDPKIWLGFKLLATYIKIRPGEMRNVRERDINLESGFIHIPHPKEGSNKRGKFAYLDAEDIDLIKSFPRSLDPDLYFSRHMANRSGVQIGAQSGPKFFKKWCRRRESNPRPSGLFWNNWVVVATSHCPMFMTPGGQVIERCRHISPTQWPPGSGRLRFRARPQRPDARRLNPDRLKASIGPSGKARRAAGSAATAWL